MDHLAMITLRALADAHTVGRAEAILERRGYWTAGNEADDWELRTREGVHVLTIWTTKGDEDFEVSGAFETAR
ncbi:hypothetical protein SEA_BUMBLE_73 [Arthrobacter phage Bumble]